MEFGIPRASSLTKTVEAFIEPTGRDVVEKKPCGCLRNTVVSMSPLRKQKHQGVESSVILIIYAYQVSSSKWNSHRYWVVQGSLPTKYVSDLKRTIDTLNNLLM